MASYLWPAPKQVRETAIPEGGNAAILHILRTLPFDRAIVLEFESLEHLAVGRNVLQLLAYRELGFRLRTHKVRDSATPQLMIWRMEAEVEQAPAFVAVTPQLPLPARPVIDWAAPEMLC